MKGRPVRFSSRQRRRRLHSARGDELAAREALAPGPSTDLEVVAPLLAPTQVGLEKGARELVRFLELAFQALDAYERMRARSPATIGHAIHDKTLDFQTRRYLQRLYALKRDDRFTFERFWPLYFNR